MQLSIVAAIAVSLLPLAALAQSSPAWIADSRTLCRVWDENPQPQEPIAWSGICSGGLAQGRGVLQWYQVGRPNGRYEGEFRDGKQNGHGVCTWANGNRYDGEYRDGKQKGRGVHPGPTAAATTANTATARRTGSASTTMPPPARPLTASGATAASATATAGQGSGSA